MEEEVEEKTSGYLYLLYRNGKGEEKTLSQLGLLRKIKDAVQNNQEITKGKEKFESITAEQQAAANFLFQFLMDKYKIRKDNIFRHPQVQAKNETEAESVVLP